MDWEGPPDAHVCGIPGFGMQDRANDESQGPIFDRTLERLAPSDSATSGCASAVIDSRRRMMAERADPPGLDPKLHPRPCDSVRLPKDAAWVEADRTGPDHTVSGDTPFVCGGGAKSKGRHQ